MTTSQKVPGNTGRIQAVILDWAGTAIDFGSRAPAQVFREIFVREGVNVTERQAREPMGRAKRDHIAAVMANPEVSAIWKAAKGNPPVEADIDRLYETFLPLQKEILGQHVDLIPGLLESMHWLKQRGVRIGSTTGYTRALMEVVIPQARAAGYEPEAIVCSDDVPLGRPSPWMLLEAAKQLNVFPIGSIVKVDDTPVGIDEGLNAGCWTIAVTASGNELGLSEAELKTLPTQERQARQAPIRDMFQSRGAHLTIESVAELPAAIQTIEQWMIQGRSPTSSIL